MGAKPEWEKRYLHARAVRDAYYFMHGETPPEDAYGQLSAVPLRLRRKYVGSLYWQFLHSEGHSSSAYKNCTCRSGYKKEEDLSYESY